MTSGRIYSGADLTTAFALALISQPCDPIMNKLQFKGEWHELKGKLRQTFAVLSDDDLNYAEGQEEELLGHLQQKLGRTQAEIAKLINS